jgi:hypothetical protein
MQSVFAHNPKPVGPPNWAWDGGGFVNVCAVPPRNWIIPPDADKSDTPPICPLLPTPEADPAKDPVQLKDQDVILRSVSEQLSQVVTMVPVTVTVPRLAWVSPLNAFNKLKLTSYVLAFTDSGGGSQSFRGNLRANRSVVRASSYG